MVRPATEWARRRVDRLFSRVHLDHMEQLRNLTRGSSAAADPHIGRGLTALVQRALSGSSASLLEPHGEDDDLAVVARDGAVVQPPRRVLSADSPAVRWLRSRRTILSLQSLLAEPRLQETPQAEKAALAELGAALLVPLLTPRDELSGVLVLGPKANGRPYALDDRELLESLGREAAMALENARLFRDAARARETLQAWLHSLPDAVMIVDRDGIVRFLNKEGAARFGQRAGQRTFLSGGSLSEREVGRFSETIRGREHEIAFAPLVDPDGHVSTVYVLRDVTGRREEKAQRDLLETRARMASHLASIGEMASGIAHEINNPLTAVIGYSRLLRDQPLPEEARESVQGIVEGATRVAGIVQRLLTFARQKKPTRKKVDLNEVIRSTLELRAYALRTGSISVSTRLDPSLPATMADAQQMQQVLLNLIINAETAMKSVRPRGELLLMSGGDERRIHIMVKDDGPGVPREIQDRIFDPFFTTQEEGKGTGLGLSICHGIVSEHGGRIWVRSTPGEGAEFHVEIPVTGGGEEAAERVRAPVPSARPSRILVVDDEQAVRELLCKILNGAGHQVDAAPDGTSALEMIARASYDAILLDLRMPGMSGMEVYEKASRIFSAMPGRTIFMTGDVMAEELDGYLRRARLPVIPKPFDPREILEILASRLGP
jgi:signal transduction histidine kinase/CheY-like chemotaxis protein